MKKLEIRAVIKYFYLKGLTATQVKSILYSTLPSNTIVKRRVSEFRMERTSTSDEPRSERPNEVTNLEMILTIHKIVMDDRRLKVREIAEAVGTSSESVHNILHENLDVKKLCARWVPRLLTLDQKQRREYVSLYKRSPSEFLRRFLTVNRRINGSQEMNQLRNKQRQFHRLIRLRLLFFRMRVT